MSEDQDQLSVEILPQPDDATCGPTCLHAVYRYFGDDLPIQDVIREVVPLQTGGTLAVWLAIHALARGYRAYIYTYNLQVFDPTWFSVWGVDLAQKLREQRERKTDPKIREATAAYLEFLERGGEIRFEDLSPELIRRFLRRRIPILTGLSATYLYSCAREGRDYDDVGGTAVGHFVVLCGYDRERREVLVADPIYDNPGFRRPYYRVGIPRLIGAILLGILTFDANLLVIEPKKRLAKGAQPSWPT